MNKKEFSKKVTLRLNKSTVVNLNHDEMHQVNGGVSGLQCGTIAITNEIAKMCQELDMETGNWYKNRPMDTEADRAIEFVYKNM